VTVMDKDKIIKYYEAKLRHAKEVRQTYEHDWEDIMNHIAPDLKGYLITERKDKGERTDEYIYDNAPASYSQKCSAGMFASISSPSRPWLQRKMSNARINEIPGVRAWLDDVTKTDYAILHESNFYPRAHTMYLHLPNIGTAVMIIDKDYENIVHCTTLNVGEYWLDIDGKGIVDSLYREIEYTAAQLVELFGEDNLPGTITDSITEDDPVGNRSNTVVHVIAPDDMHIAPFKKPYVSLYYLRGKSDKQIIEIKGYNRKPFVSPRWYVNNNETYGKMCPGRNSLGNCKQLQSMMYDYMDAINKELNPATQGTADLSEVSTIPGDYNKINPTGPDATIKRLVEINPQLAVMWQAIQDKKQQISEDFYIDLFMSVSMREDKQMTAEEVRAISGERMMALGPALENMHDEFLNPATEILFDYGMEAGVYPDIRNYVSESDLQYLQGQNIKTDYISIMAQAQKIVDLGRIDQVIAYGEKLAGLDPTVMDKLDSDQVIDEVADMTGAPGSIIRSDEAVVQIRQNRAKQQQMQQAAEMAQTAANVGSAASKMPMDQDTALTRFLGVQ